MRPGVFCAVLCLLHAAPDKAPAMENWPMPPPPGFVDFCHAAFGECVRSKITVGNLGIPDRSARRKLRAVNRYVNAAIRPLPEEQNAGDDHWTLPLSAGADPAGDCEDYALEKRHLLLQEGWPSSDLRLAVVLVPSVGLHTVLIANYGRSEVVLDNLNPELKRVSQTPYQLVSIQSRTDDLLWYRAAN